jgi:hypothetical protein
MNFLPILQKPNAFSLMAAQDAFYKSALHIIAVFFSALHMKPVIYS